MSDKKKEPAPKCPECGGQAYERMENGQYESRTCADCRTYLGVFDPETGVLVTTHVDAPIREVGVIHDDGIRNAHSSEGACKCGGTQVRLDNEAARVCCSCNAVRPWPPRKEVDRQRQQHWLATIHQTTGKLYPRLMDFLKYSPPLAAEDFSRLIRDVSDEVANERRKSRNARGF